MKVRACVWHEKETRRINEDPGAGFAFDVAWILGWRGEKKRWVCVAAKKRGEKKEQKSCHQRCDKCLNKSCHQRVRNKTKVLSSSVVQLWCDKCQTKGWCDKWLVTFLKKKVGKKWPKGGSKGRAKNLRFLRRWKGDLKKVCSSFKLAS